jgi:hypothetical protein
MSGSPFSQMSPWSVVYLLATAGLYGLLVLALLVAQLVEFCLRPKAMRRYLGYGLAAAVVVLALDVLILVFEPRILHLAHPCYLVAVDLIAFLKLILFTSVGLYCCAAMARRDLPLLKPLMDRGGPPLWLAAPATLAVTAWGVGLTWVLFTLTQPHLSGFLRNLSENQRLRAGIAEGPTPMVVCVLLAFAVGEELLFRLSIQNYLAHRLRLSNGRYWIAVLLATALWTLGHANVLEPGWVKFVQIFAFGIPLGYLFRWFGLESCLVAHAAFNLILNFYGSDWIVT